MDGLRQTKCPVCRGSGKETGRAGSHECGACNGWGHIFVRGQGPADLVPCSTVEVIGAELRVFDAEGSAKASAELSRETWLMVIAKATEILRWGSAR